MTQITLLDGSIGQELMKRSGDKPTTIWSIQVMMDHPGMVQEVHEEYFRAGATIATTNTYCVHRDRLRKVDLDPELMPDLVENALHEAESACAGNGGAGRIAGALGPLEASYRPDICLPPETAAPAFAELVELMKDRVDFFLIETVSSLEHAEGVLRGVAQAGKPVWLAVTVDDEDGTKLRSGEDLQGLLPLVQVHQPDAVLVNCSRPEAVTAALDIIRGFDKPFGAYANGFTHISDGFLEDKPTVDALEARIDLTPLAYAEFVQGWIGQGATIVGGCCEVGPDHIAELSRQLKANGHQIV
ncbi:homocysteine S-methyltransferase family protein [uncultured Roseovarius sp.]|uniref:homocysteine S-methyltransferase family protein n=1 Tax=uncultured Roseovarius sp. TaxID=293344 RepID=UPI002609C425|nr:homocysteine S-methyltransferase family protein [uncultured Roseovarius sp.]